MNGPGTAHFYTGLVNSAWVRQAHQATLPNGCVKGLITEGRNYRGGKGWLRRFQALWVERRWIAAFDVVFAMGALGERWFHMNGYPQDKVFGFCYVVSPERAAVVDRPDSESVEFLYAGQLVPRKNVGLLFEALKMLTAHPFHLTVVGDGPMRAQLEALSRTLGISKRVSFLGAQDNAVTRQLMARSDVLVLPSRYDGWGAVVNEALQMGARVVVSDNCGASDLVVAGSNGSVFPEGSLIGLAEALEALLLKGPLSRQHRAGIAAMSRTFEAETVADYVLAVLDHTRGHADASERPPVPWRAWQFDQSVEAAMASIHKTCRRNAAP